MPKATITDERAFDGDRFATSELFRSDRLKAVFGYFEPGQFIPVHEPASDVVISVQSGTGLVREGKTEHRVEPGDVVVVEANTARGIKAETELEALLVTAPPPTDKEHDPVRKGLKNDEFEP
jgi:quercetin dioxygenase-like cupin family protein